MNWMQSLQAENYREVEEDAAEYLGESKQTLPRFDLDLLDGAPPPDRKWVLPGFIPCGEITLFTGPGGAGKSLFAQQLATALAGGVPFLGIGASGEKTTALYVTAEDDEFELHRRQRNIMSTLDLDRADVGDRLGLISLRGRIGNELVTFDRDGSGNSSAAYQLAIANGFTPERMARVIDAQIAEPIEGTGNLAQLGKRVWIGGNVVEFAITAEGVEGRVLRPVGAQAA